ncbi:MAG: TerC family protein [Acidobacteriota bacterium]
MDGSIFAEVMREIHALAPMDGLTILTLALLEGILSVDNALVLAILVRSLPRDQQKKALTYGIVGAFAFRFIALVFATYLMRLVIFKLLGGAYLIYLAMKHMFFFQGEATHEPTTRPKGGFWKVVAMVELTDIAFSIDSITTAVAMSNKIVVVWTGGILGIISLRFLASFFVKLLERLPRLEDLAYQLIFFIGIKLAFESFHVEIDHSIFWIMMGVIAVLGSALVYRDYHQRRTKTAFHNRLLDRLEKNEISIEELLDLDYIPREVVDYLREKGCLTIEVPTEPEGCSRIDKMAG